MPRISQVTAALRDRRIEGWDPNMRRRTPPVPHRELFRAVNSDEVIACLCTCTRGVDHWYAEPIGSYQAEPAQTLKTGAAPR